MEIDPADTAMSGSTYREWGQTKDFTFITDLLILLLQSSSWAITQLSTISSTGQTIKF